MTTSFLHLPAVPSGILPIVFTLCLGTNLLVTACGGGPKHNGYKTESAKPWQTAHTLTWNSTGEAEGDGYISWRDRSRAKWFQIELPSDGELSIKIAKTFADENSTTDIAFEVLDTSYRILTVANHEEDDAGEPTKERTLYDLLKGSYYIHVYVQKKTDSADFTLVAQHKPGLLEGSTPPAITAGNADFIPPLPMVPVVDDTPKTAKKKPIKPTAKPVAKLKKRYGRIIRVVRKGSGNRITINAGAAAGVQVGWKGAIIGKTGKTIKNGRFKVSKVTNGESYGQVKASRQEILAAKRIVVYPP